MFFFIIKMRARAAGGRHMHRTAGDGHERQRILRGQGHFVDQVQIFTLVRKQHQRIGRMQHRGQQFPASARCLSQRFQLATERLARRELGRKLVRIERVAIVHGFSRALNR